MISLSTASAALPTAPSPPLDWRLESCPACGYALEGLPPEGICPECGRAYDQRTIILTGWSAGELATAIHASSSYLAFPCVICCFLLFISWQMHRASTRLGGTILALSVVAWAGWVFWSRRSHGANGSVQVHLSEEGFRQIYGGREDRTPFVPWSRTREFKMFATSADRYRVSITRRVAWWKPVLRLSIVDAEVRCLDSLATAVRAKVAEWRAVA